jgi:hypothetical protein
MPTPARRAIPAAERRRYPSTRTAGAADDARSHRSVVKDPRRSGLAPDQTRAGRRLAAGLRSLTAYRPVPRSSRDPRAHRFALAAGGHPMRTDLHLESVSTEDAPICILRSSPSDAHRTAPCDARDSIRTDVHSPPVDIRCAPICILRSSPSDAHRSAPCDARHRTGTDLRLATAAIESAPICISRRSGSKAHRFASCGAQQRTRLDLHRALANVPRDCRPYIDRTSPPRPWQWACRRSRGPVGCPEGFRDRAEHGAQI